MSAGPARRGRWLVPVLAVVLAGCGAPAGGSGGGSSDASGHDDADVAFATDMVPHHAQGIAMADLAVARTQSPGVRQLAHEMAAEEMPEIVQMQDLLSQWGRPPAPTAAMPGMSGGGMGGDAATDPQMRDLNAASGPAFDRLFLRTMIKHHGLGVTMAATELSGGENGDAEVLAQNISDSQQSQITVMLQMLGDASPRS